MDQAIKFEEVVAVSKFTLFLECPEDVMQQRLLKRGQTSGRADDNEEVIKKRFKTFIETTMPVVNYFESQGRVVKVSAVPPPDEVQKEIEAEFKKRGLDLK
jgi:UMP-CMP kinase